MVKTKTYLVSSIVFAAVIAGLFSIGTLDEQPSTPNSYTSEPTIAQLSPVVDIITPEEFVAQSSSSVLEPEEFKIDSSFDASSDFKLGLIPFIQNVDAISPSTTTVTFERWTTTTLNPTNAATSTDSADNIFFLERNLNRVARLNPNTNAVTMWIPPDGANSFTSFIDSGKFYWVGGSSRLQELDPSTNTITSWNLAGSLISPKKAPNGLFYGIYNSGSSLIELDPSTGDARFWNNIFGSGGQDMDIDSSGNIWVAHSSGLIYKFNPTNNERTHWNSPSGGTLISYSIDIDTTSDDVYIAGSGRVQKFEPSTHTLTTWVPIDGTAQIRGSMALDSLSNPYFVSADQREILRLIPSQNQFTIWNLDSFATGISLDSNDRAVFASQDLSGSFSYNKIGRLS